jgi:hypothetical protein
MLRWHPALSAHEECPRMRTRLAGAHTGAHMAALVAEKEDIAIASCIVGGGGGEMGGCCMLVAASPPGSPSRCAWAKSSGPGLLVQVKKPPLDERATATNTCRSTADDKRDDGNARSRRRAAVAPGMCLTVRRSWMGGGGSYDKSSNTRAADCADARGMFFLQMLTEWATLDSSDRGSASASGNFNRRRDFQPSLSLALGARRRRRAGAKECRRGTHNGPMGARGAERTRGPFSRRRCGPTSEKATAA